MKTLIVKAMNKKKEFTDFWMMPAEQRIGVTDSLHLESGTKVASGQVGKVKFLIEVHGDVRVLYKDEIYKSPDRFPEELREIIRRKEQYTHPEIEIGNNNWFELMMWNAEGELIYSDLAEIDEDIEKMSEQDMKDYILDEMEFVQKYI